MAWIIPRTWVPGELVTASMMNAHVRDNESAIKAQMFSTQTFRGLHLRTHPDADKAANQVALLSLDEVVMSDAFRYTGLSSLPLVADITASGAAGLDTGSRVASTWYEVHLIGKSTTQAASDLRLLLHRSKDYLLDTSFTTAFDASRALRLATSTATDKLAQGVKFATSGPLAFVDLQILRAGAVSGRIWVSLQADTAGDATGTPLATSDKMDASLISTSAQVVRFVFRTPFSAVATTQYHLVLEGDYTRSDSIFITWKGLAAGGYVNGVARDFNGTAWANDTACGDFWFKAYITENDTAPTFPTGYDKSCKVGYVYNNGSNVLNLFDQHQRLVRIERTTAASGISSVPTLVDMSTFFPPATVHFWSEVSASVADDAIVVGGVPGGYGSVLTMHTISPSTTFSGLNGPVVTELQGLYLSDATGGTASVLSSAWEW